MNEGREIALIEDRTVSFGSKIELALMNEGREIELALIKDRTASFGLKNEGKERWTHLVIKLAPDEREEREIELVWWLKGGRDRLNELTWWSNMPWWTRGQRDWTCLDQRSFFWLEDQGGERWGERRERWSEIQRVTAFYVTAFPLQTAMKRASSIFKIVLVINFQGGSSDNSRKTYILRRLF